ncbi:MAG: hypothetical protein SVM80_11175 [Halobacteriota archaeon]|nr:hypothetical protein [Halobacteriota archaeon]
MTMKRRPYQDDFVYCPPFRQLYSACWLGRPGDDNHEEPIKYTQALNEYLSYESYQEWTARLNENTMAADMFIKGELAKEAEKLEKLTGKLSDAEEEDVSAASDIGAVEEIVSMDEVLAEDMFTSYGFQPPIFNMPVRLGPAIVTMLLGNSNDTFYHAMDTFTLEQSPCLINWHYEDGVQVSSIYLWYENAEEILNRRHMRTGEMFKYLCVQRPPHEGCLMVADILMDIRNERTPEFADTPMVPFAFQPFCIPDCQSVCRSVWDFVKSLLGCIGPALRGDEGTAGRPYLAWVPYPSLMELMLQLPLDTVVSRFVGVMTGVNWYMTRYNLTHLETTMEVIGQEKIPAAPEESHNSYVVFGMDRIRYPSSFIQSKRAYGQEGHIRDPTDYPLPEKSILLVEDANKEVKKAREEHPEWLTDIKGLGN